MKNNAFLTFISLCLAAASATAATPVATTPASAFSATDSRFLSRSREMFADGNFRGTVDQLQYIATEATPLSESQREEFLYLLGSAYAETGDPRCLDILATFINTFPASDKAREVNLRLADFHFFAHDWQRALEGYDRVDISSLDASARHLYSYRKGICLIRTGDYAAARPLIKSLTGVRDYELRALYYDAYIDYAMGRDEAALSKFMKVSNRLADPAPLPPCDRELRPNYYIAQLLFRQGRWEESIRVAENLLRRDDVAELIPDTHRILGLALYETGDLTGARGPLDSYVEAAGEKATPDALYALGACEYEEGDLRLAATHFRPLLDLDNAIGQGANLYMGQIEAEEGNPSAAAINFERAYRTNFDNKVAETALYNYVAAKSKGGTIPFDSSVELLESFIKVYPSSEYAPIVDRQLAILHYRQGDYEKALDAIDRIRRPDAADPAIQQKILYAAGCARMSAGNPKNAESLLARCVAINADPSIRCQANIWLGDARYALGNYAGAERAYSDAIKSGETGENATLAAYGMGYALLMQDKFSQAAGYFKKALAGSLTADLKADARMRIADCKYYTGDYKGALTDFASMREGENADYALYRHAQMLGLNGDINGKIRELELFGTRYPASRWLSNALNELADTYASAGNHTKAAEAYSEMLGKYPVAPGAAKAALGMATSLMNIGKTDEAVAAYREILLTRPASDEARVADRELRRYYADNHQLGEYADFLRDIPGYSLNAADIDDLAYETAENEYLGRKNSITGIEEYISSYPSGRHIAEAYSIYAGHLTDTGDRNGALRAYRELERRGGAEYAAEAYTGIMRNADNPSERLEYARRVRAAGGADADALEEADFYEASALIETRNAADARRGRQMLERLAGNPYSEFGAQSNVLLARTYLDNGDPERTREMMEEFTSSGSGQQYWVARGFILLADAYEALGKSYLAKEYLKSLRQNYPGDEADIREMISTRLK